MKKSLTAALILSLLLTFSSALAAAPEWKIDPAHSNIYFSTIHIYSTITGRFDEFSADIRFDPEDLGSSSFRFEIPVASINTHVTKRDKHLLSADFFDESKYPNISFVSNTISPAEKDGSYNIEGVLTIKGKEYKLNLPLTLLGVQDHPAMKGTRVAGFDGRITIDRLAHGVGTGKFYKLGIVGKEVDILVSLEVLQK